MNRALLYFLDDLLQLNLHFTITSALRTKAQNEAAGGASNSQHLIGEAIDFKPYGSTTYNQLLSYIMDNVAYKNENFEKDSYTPELVEGNPCYQASVYDSVMYDESPDGDLIQCDMTQILLNQEKYRRLLGDMNVNNILAQMHPTQSTAMDQMTDEERFDCVISRHCQTMSERQAVLRQLANEKSELCRCSELY
jgi:hypothetical protein